MSNNSIASISNASIASSTHEYSGSPDGSIRSKTDKDNVQSDSAAVKAPSQTDAEVTRQLSERDREVRNHERIHASVGGALASAPSYSYERGPDGQMYAVEGEVNIDTSSVSNNPQATLEKAEIIIRAALSVPEPSTQDRRVAADARMMAAEARAEIAQAESLEAENSQEKSEESDEASQAETLQASDRAAQAEQEKKDKEDDDEKSSVARAAQQEKDEAAATALKDFNNRLNDIQKTLREINLKITESGAMQKRFPAGSLINDQA